MPTDPALKPATASPARTVLLVDDEESIRFAVGKFLRKRGYEVTAAANGGEALDALFRQNFDVMVCDIRMPEMTGLEIVPSALEASPDIAILMLTAVNDAPTATEALALGALDYLTKPIELSALAEAIERALAKRGVDARQRDVDFQIREEFTTRAEQFYRTQKVLAEALSVALGDLASDVAMEKLRALSDGRLNPSDLDLVQRVLTNRKSLPGRDVAR